jgi:cytochrome c5
MDERAKYFWSTTIAAAKYACGGLAVFTMALLQQQALAENADRSGQQVVDAVCAKCHATGKLGSPKIGDRKAWAKLTKEGLNSLSQHALDGIRQMPTHGGDLSLTDTEIRRAVTYMVNQSGGHWTEPISETKPVAARSGEQIVKMQCYKCHEKGVGGAPKIGDRDAWAPRLKNGLDVTVRSAINGHGGMPARGGMANLTDAELRDAIIYMFSKGSEPSKGS